MISLVLEFAIQRSRLEVTHSIVRLSDQLTNILDGGLQYPERISNYVADISNFSRNETEISNYLFSLWDDFNAPERWITIGAVSAMKFIRTVNCAPWPDLNVLLPPEAAFCASAIELSIARFDYIVGKLTLEQLKEQMNFSQRSRICILACIYCLIVANENLPQGTIELVSEWEIQEHDFETGILVILILKESNYMSPDEKINTPQDKSLSTTMSLMSNFYFIGTVKW